MRIAPLKTNDPWLGRAMSSKDVLAHGLRGVPVETVVEVELIEVLHGAPEENYRPYLHLRGELSGVLPAVDLPYGVTELASSRGSGMRVDAFYDFSQEQLADLVTKGYFTEAFQVPEDMASVPWNLPGSADFVVLAPYSMDEPPIVFMEVHDVTGLELDEANSGYTLSEYFPDYTPQAAAAKQARLESVAEYEGSGIDMFHDADLDMSRPVTASLDAATSADELSADNDGRTPVPAGVFARLLSEIEAHRDAGGESVRDSEAEAITLPEPGSVEELYGSVIAPGVKSALEGEDLSLVDVEVPAPVEDLEAVIEDVVSEVEAERSQEKDETDLFGDEPMEPEPELTPLPISTQPDTSGGHSTGPRRRAQERLRQQLLEEQESEKDTGGHELG